MSIPALFVIKPSTTANQVDVDPVPDAQVGELPAGLTSLAGFDSNGTQYLLAYSGSSKSATVYQAYDETSQSYLKEVAAGPLDGEPAIISAFQVATRPWLLTYNPASEYADFIRVGDDLSLTSVYRARIGVGFTEVHPFAYRFGMYFVAYDGQNGNVARYQLMVPAHGQLHAQQTWTDIWAHGWTRFGFFSMGGETFFIKTNTVHKKVNIDHFMDDANEGSHPVLDIDVPAQMDGLEAVSAYNDAQGNPYFVTYRANGQMTVNRVWGSCLGWNVEATVDATPNASSLATFPVGGSNYVLVYSAS